MSGNYNPPDLKNKVELFELENGMKVKKETFDRFSALPQKDRMLLLKYMKSKKEDKETINSETPPPSTSILEVPENKNENEKEDEKDDKEEEKKENESKKIIITDANVS